MQLFLRNIPVAISRDHGLIVQVVTRRAKNKRQLTIIIIISNKLMST
jgi:hypothetical protein